MTTIAELVTWLDRFAPFRTAERWDNVGLLLGDPSTPVEQVMTCLTVTSETVAEAIDGRAELVVSHHPILFKPVQQFRADRPETGLVWRLARAGIALASPHTAFDNCTAGINAHLASLLELRDVRPLSGYREGLRFKIVVFCPSEVRSRVLEDAFAAGAGHIGDYRECSFSGAGVGTFLGGETTHPTIGTQGHRERVREWRIELIVEERKLPGVLAAIRHAHSYEEPAIDVYRLEPPESDSGIGRIGELPEPATLDALARRIAGRFGLTHVDVVGAPGLPVQKLAVACGAGDDLLELARGAGADAVLTGEIRYHKALAAGSDGLGLIVIGHHASERPGVDWLASQLAQGFPRLRVWSSRLERDPFRRLLPTE